MDEYATLLGLDEVSGMALKLAYDQGASNCVERTTPGDHALPLGTGAAPRSSAVTTLLMGAAGALAAGALLM